MLASDPTRVERGRAARKAVPRSSHAEFTPAPGRTDPVEQLARHARTRVAELVPVRVGRMLSSPFAFFRGAAAIMAEDLASTPVSGLRVQCCGDAHISNFSVFASPERRLVFDINHFDETLRAPWEWDVKRLAASMLIAARDNGFGRRDQRRIVLRGVSRYREAMTEFAAMGNLDVWYSRLDIDVEGRLASHTKRFAPGGARKRDGMSTLAKLTRGVDGLPRLADQSPLIVPIDKLADGTERERIRARLQRILSAYGESLGTEARALFEQFDVADFARMVLGVGSVGAHAWIALLLGPAGCELLLEIREAQWSVLQDYAGAVAFANQAERVVVGQRLMQASPDVFLGWLRTDRDYYVRRLKAWKGAAAIADMSPDAMDDFARLCGWTLARAHARTGDRIAIAAYLGRSDSFEKAILAFSESYADQNRRDYEVLVDASAAGRFNVETDPNLLRE